MATPLPGRPRTAHLQPHPRPRGGLPRHDWTGQWLYSQCTVYDELHPHQQRLLADLGLTPEGARAARPRHIPQAAAFAAGLAHARAWAQEHGNLAVPEPARHDGYRLGTWLRTQRGRADRGKLPTDRIKALETIDPHWNPAGGLRWHQAYLTARAHTTGRSLTTTADFNALPADTAKWLFTQCSSYDSLHPEQQQQLADIGLTSERARTLAPPPKPPQPARPASPRLKNPPSAFTAGLPYAQAWAAQHGNLTSADYRTEHDGFPLGWWLYKQRRAAHDHLKRTGNPWLHDTQLAVLDPWWNPPWRATWNHSWHQAHTHYTAGLPFPNQTTKWIRTQQRAWEQLHPHQQHLMTTLGIHGPTPLCRYNSRPANPTDQPTKLINTHETNPEQETRSSQARSVRARKQHQAPRQHTPHRRTQPAN
ncbi:helicase associated domain-containing protein [Streptomyces sp. NPDC014805]|uniref:helicase associated domain-containing protein n=1 Tax=Streptomyces sp. NPDC014805 TaxID=3364919 RepID=UPI0036F75246